MLLGLVLVKGRGCLVNFSSKSQIRLEDSCLDILIVAIYEVSNSDWSFRVIRKDGVVKAELLFDDPCIPALFDEDALR